MFGIKSSVVSLYLFSKIKYFVGFRIYEKYLRSLDTISLKNIRIFDLWFLSSYFKNLTSKKGLTLIFKRDNNLTFTRWHLRTIHDTHDWKRVIHKWGHFFWVSYIFLQQDSMQNYRRWDSNYKTSQIRQI